ncbi:unnamed protein product [Pylaiella littoralis]
MSYYGRASGIHGSQGGNYNSAGPPSQPPPGVGGGGYYQPVPAPAGQYGIYGPADNFSAQQYQQGKGPRGKGGGGGGAGGGGSKWSSGSNNNGGPGGAGGMPGGGGGGGYPRYNHAKGNNQSTGGKPMNVNDMSPDRREAHLAVKAAQKHAQRLEDPEPEKLEVPQDMLTEVHEAARAVNRHFRHSHHNKHNSSGSTPNENDAPQGRRREVWGGNSSGVSSPPPPSHKGAAYDDIQSTRRKLPAYARQEEILDVINNNQVVVISGETGCGKTTQGGSGRRGKKRKGFRCESGGILWWGPSPSAEAASVPQFLMDQYRRDGVGESATEKPYNIVCTQPRRISAIGVAERVAAERGETVGGTVGYQIRLERRASEHTKLLFVTTGILLRRLQADPQLEGVTHVILDEVHERTVDSDFLIIILRDLALQRKDLTLVLMSATLNADLFSNYFSNAPKLNIPGYTFPVEEFYLEDALELTRTRITPTVNRQGRVKRKPLGPAEYQQKASAAAERERGRGRDLPPGRYSQRTLESLAMFDESEVPLDVIVDLVQYVHAYEGDGAILIFLSGWEEISAVHDRLEMLPQARAWRLYALHSQMPTSQQRDVFLRPPRGTRKIVIATNIAESSITIDDVVFVIDGGKHKEKSYDPEAKVQSLLPAWVSQASSRQRRGRAGRVQPGRCWHLYPRSKVAEMSEYQLPEIVRTSLESLCLQVRHLGLASPGRRGVAGFINKALTPPGVVALNNALTLLTRIGAFRTDESLTPLGKHLALLPVEPQIGKALVLGCMLGCLDPVLTIAALLSQRNPFVMPMSKKEQADAAKRRFAQGEPSDHLCLYNAYEAWRACPRRDQQDFCHVNFLSPSALRTASEVRGQFQTLLRDAGLIPRDRDQLAELNRHSEMPKFWPVVRAAMCSGLYPNLVRVDYGKKKFKLLSADHSTLNPHPSSVTSEGNPFNRRWAYYHEMCRTPGGLFIYDLTEASALPLLLFGAGDPRAGRAPGALMSKLVTGAHIPGGAKKKKGKKKGHVPSVGPFAGVEPWVYFDVGNSRGVLEEIRAALEYVITEHVGGARSSERETRLIDTVAQALVGEEELANPSKPGGGHDRTQHPHGTMRAYNVDADDDYEFHRNVQGGGEYRGSGPGAFRGYGDNGSSSNNGGGGASASSSRGCGGGGGGFSSSTSVAHAGRPRAGQYSAGGGGGGGVRAQNGSGYMQQHMGGDRDRDRGGSSSHFRKSSPPGGEKPPEVGDARYAAAEAAVAAALGHASISGSSAMPASAHASAGFGIFSHYGGGGSGSGSGGMARAPRGGGGGGLGPGGGPPRYNPPNGDSSGGGGGGYHRGGRGDQGGASQPRSLARPGGVASHEFNRGGGGGGGGSSMRPAAHSPVSTVLGGAYHNYAVPPGSMPLGGSGGGSEQQQQQQQQQQHYVSRVVHTTRGEDSRDRDGHGGRGGKRGRW